MNTINLPASELKSALTGLNKIVGRSSTLPVLQHLRVYREKRGAVCLQATSLDAFVTYRANDAQPGPEVDVLVPLDQLNKAVKSSQDSICLLIEDKEKVKVRYVLAGCPCEQSLKTLLVNEWPPVPVVTAPAVALEKEFGSTLKQALECCGNDSGRYVLCGACLDVQDRKSHYIIATNGRMLYSANSFSFGLKKSVIIPDSKFLTGSDFLEDLEGTLAVGPGQDKKAGNWVKLETPNWSFVAKEIDGKYPNWKQVVPPRSDKATQILLGESAIKQLLAIIPRLPGDDGPVRLRTDHDKVFAEGRGPDDKDWTSVAVPDAVAKGRVVSVSLNRRYLATPLRFGLNHIEIDATLSPVVFWNGGRKMVVMPLCPGDETVKTSACPAQPAVLDSKQEQPPTPSQVKTETQERKTMHSTERGSPGTNHNGATQEPRSALKAAVEKVEQLKTSLRDLQGQLVEVVTALKAAEKEQRGASREFESVRATLRSLQKIAI